MNKTKTLIAVAAIAALAAGAYYAFSGKGSDCAETIPADATAIVRFDVKRFLHDARLSNKEGVELLTRLTKMEDAALGLDLSTPVYGFVTKEGNIGMASMVTNEDDLTKNCEHLLQMGCASAVTKQRGYSWAVVEQKWLLCFNNKKALVMGPAVGGAQDQLRTEIVRLMEQDRSDSGAKSVLFTKLDKVEEPLSAVADANVMPGDIRRELMKYLKADDLQGVQVLLGLGTEDNEIQLDADVVADQPAVEERLKALGKTFRPITGDLIARAEPSALLWAACNVEGASLVELLRKNPQVRTALIGLNTIVDADMMLKAVDGDVSVECTSLSFVFGWRNNLPVRLMAQLHDTDFLKQSDYWIKSAASNPAVQLTSSSPNNFELSGNGMQAWFGVSDKTLYLTGSSSLAHAEKVSAPNDYISDERHHIKGLRFYASVDIEPLTNLARAFGGNDALKTLLTFQRINVEMKEVGEFSIRLVAPKGTNIVKEMLK